MIGKKFGRLTVLEEVDVIRSGVKRKYLKCVCDCGNKKTVRRDSVRAGETSYHADANAVRPMECGIRDFIRFGIT